MCAGNGRIELEIPAFMHFAVDEKSEMAPTSWHSYSHSLWVKLKSETALAAEARDLLGLEPLPTSKYTQGASSLVHADARSHSAGADMLALMDVACL